MLVFWKLSGISFGRFLKPLYVDLGLKTIHGCFRDQHDVGTRGMHIVRVVLRPLRAWRAMVKQTRCFPHHLIQPCWMANTHVSLFPCNGWTTSILAILIEVRLCMTRILNPLGRTNITNDFVRRIKAACAHCRSRFRPRIPFALSIWFINWTE